MQKQAFRHLKDEAITLRLDGKSYNEINALLWIPKSTLSNWLKDLPKSEIIKEDCKRRASEIWANNIVTYNKKRHEEYIKHTQEQAKRHIDLVPTMTKRDLFFLFMGMFWGEGAKKERWAVQITNANPRFIQMALRFLRENCAVTNEKIHPCIHLHVRNDVDSAVNYWCNITGIPKENIRTQLVVSSASKDKRPTSSLPNGTFNLIVNNAKLCRQTHAWLEGVTSQSIKPR